MSERIDTFFVFYGENYIHGQYKTEGEAIAECNRLRIKFPQNDTIRTCHIEGNLWRWSVLFKVFEYQLAPLDTPLEQLSEMITMQQTRIDELEKRLNERKA